jgi:hypothetical protein
MTPVSRSTEKSKALETTCHRAAGLALGRRFLTVAGPAALIVSSCALFRGALWPAAGQGLFGFDLSYQFEPWWRFWVDRVRSGALPLWNPYSLLGAPFLANPQVGQLYPPNWLFLLAPFRFAVGWLAAFHIALAAVGMYVWTGCLGISRWGRTVAGFTFAFSAFFVLRMYAGNYSHIASMSWFPWLLYVGFRVCHFTSSKSVAIASVVTALAFLAGSPPYFAITGGFTGLACVFWAFRQPTPAQRWHSLAGLWLMVLVWILLAAAQLVPLIELVAYSTRAAHSTYEFATSFSLMRQSFASIVAPDLLTMVAFWEFHLFAGAVSILLAVVALAQNSPRAWSWLGLALVALLIGLGDQAGLYPILYRILPWLGFVRAPARFAIVYLLSISVLAGMGLDRLLLRPAHLSIRMIALGAGLGLVLLSGIAWTDGMVASDSARALVTLDAIRWCFFAGLLCVLVWALRSTRRTLGVAVMVLVAFDVLPQGWRFIQVKSLQVEPRWQIVDAALPSARDTWRLLTIGPLDHEQSMDLGFYGVGGYDVLVVTWAQDMIDLGRELASPVLDMLSVRYIVADARLPEVESRARLITQSDDLFVYERSTAMPRVFAVGQYELASDPLGRLGDPLFDPRARVVLTAPPDCVPARSPSTDLDTLVVRVYQPDYVRLEADLAADRLVVLNDLYYPGWDAMVDGGSTRILQANYALRAVCVPAGAHHIEFRYRPGWLGLGVAMSATGLAVVAILWGWKTNRSLTT